MGEPFPPTVPAGPPTEFDPNPPSGTPLNPEIPGPAPVPEIPVAPPEGFPAGPPGATMAAGATAAEAGGVAVAAGEGVAGAGLIATAGAAIVAAGIAVVGFITGGGSTTGGGSGGGPGTPLPGPGTDAGHDIPVVLAEDEDPDRPDEDGRSTDAALMTERVESTDSAGGPQRVKNGKPSSARRAAS